MIYVDPSNHARENARAEGANKIIEAGIQSILYDKNLPPSWWQRACNDVMFLANRLPAYSLDSNQPPDGDARSPIELMFGGYISRHQVYRELDNYVGTGTPALCHLTKVKGSDLEPKVRWGIAIGQRGKVTLWLCPHTLSRFRSRSFTAQILRSGMNFSQFIFGTEMKDTPQSRLLPQDEPDNGRYVLILPEVRPCRMDRPPPVREIITQLEGETSNHYIPTKSNSDDVDRYEYMPVASRHKKGEAIRLPSGDLLPTVEEVDDEANDEQDSPSNPKCDGVKVLSSDGKEVPIHNPKILMDGDTQWEPPLHIEGFDVESHSDEHEPDSSDNETLTEPKTNKRQKRCEKSPGQRSREKVARQKESARKRAVKEKNDQLASMFEMDLEIDAESYDPEGEQKLEELSAKSNQYISIITDGMTSWNSVCKQVNKKNKALGQKIQNTYRLWLLTKPHECRSEPPLTSEDLPKAVLQMRTPLKAGLTLPYPDGPHWRKLLDDKEYMKKHIETLTPADEEEDVIYHAMRAYTKACRNALNPHSRPEPLAHALMAVLSQQATLDDLDDCLNDIIDTEVLRLGYDVYAARRANARAMAAKKKFSIKKRPHAKIGDQGDPAPKNMIEALLGERGEEWVKSIHKEFPGLNSQGVFSHGPPEGGQWTREALHRHGITGKPVPCSIALTHKYKDGILEKLKTRICIAGHQGNVTKGIHYHEVFSPSPVQHTEKLLQAMLVNMHLSNLCWDIEMAYTWAPLPKGERIAVVYPEGFRRVDENGDEVFAVLEKNLYGMPNAARGWGQCRDAFILEYFNGPGWRCKRCYSDPCLFVIDRWIASGKAGDVNPYPQADQSKKTEPEEEFNVDNLPEGVHRTWMLIHTDDCDAYGQSMEVLQDINRIMNDKWATKIVDNSFMLGVKRTKTIDPDTNRWTMKLTMKHFIDDLYSSFKTEVIATLGHRVPKVPFPEGVILTKAHELNVGECEANIKRGYQRLVGSLLWAVRHVSPTSAYGCSQLCKLMSAPSDRAWQAAMHMLAYLYAHGEEGIEFHETDSEPVCFVDASNKDDPVDGKCQFGYTINWGGPIIWKSSKLQHVGINSTYNEYMALHHAIKQIVWMRQLIEQMGMSTRFLTRPTLIHADNKQANNIASEDLITNGNMYFRTGYHYCKEAISDGYATVQYIATDRNISDPMTKALGGNKSRQFTPILQGQEDIDDDLLVPV